MRFVAADWSGAADGEQRHLWMAEVDGRSRRVRSAGALHQAPGGRTIARTGGRRLRRDRWARLRILASGVVPRRPRHRIRRRAMGRRRPPGDLARTVPSALLGKTRAAPADPHPRAPLAPYRAGHRPPAEVGVSDRRRRLGRHRVAPGNAYPRPAASGRLRRMALRSAPVSPWSWRSGPDWRWEQWSRAASRKGAAGFEAIVGPSVFRPGCWPWRRDLRTPSTRPSPPSPSPRISTAVCRWSMTTRCAEKAGSGASPLVGS